MNMTSASVINSAVTLISCEEAVVGDNSITHSGYTVTGTSNFPAGLRLFGLYDGLVARNDITGFESGIYLAGNFGDTQFQCNVLSDHYNGIYLNYPDLDDQGSSAVPGMNEWYNTTNSEIDGNVSSSYIFTWHYKNNGAAALIPAITATNVNPGGTGSAGINCGNLSIPQFRIANNGLNETRSPDAMEPEEIGIANESGIKLYPNPANNFLTLSFPASYINQDYFFYDFSSKLYSQSTVNRETVILDIQTWPSGLYFLKVQGKTLRFIKE